MREKREGGVAGSSVDKVLGSWCCSQALTGGDLFVPKKSCIAHIPGCKRGPGLGIGLEKSTGCALTHWAQCGTLGGDTGNDHVTSIGSRNI